MSSKRLNYIKLLIFDKNKKVINFKFCDKYYVSPVIFSGPIGSKILPIGTFHKKYLLILRKIDGVESILLKKVY